MFVVCRRIMEKHNYGTKNNNGKKSASANPISHFRRSGKSGGNNPVFFYNSVGCCSHEFFQEATAGTTRLCE